MPTADERPEPRVGPVLALLVAVRLVTNTLERFVYPFLPTIARGLGISLERAGLLVTVRGLAALFTPGVVRIAGRHGNRRRAAVVGLLVAAAGAFLVGFGGLFLPALLGFAALGLGRPTFDTSAISELSDRTPPGRRARVLGTLELTYAGGLLVGAPVAGFLISRGDWTTPFLTFGGLVVVGAVGVRLLLRAPDHEDSAERARELPRQAWELLAVFLLLGFGAEFTLLVLGAWMEDAFGLSLVALGGVATLIGLAELTGETVVLGIGDRVGPARLAAVGATIAIVGFGLVAVVPDVLALALATLALALFGFEIAIVSGIPVASEAVPHDRHVFLARVGVALSVGRAAAGISAPVVYTTFGTAANATVSAFAYLGALALLRRATK